MKYTVSSPTPISVVTLPEAKGNLRITHTMQDDMIQGMINTAVIMAENYTGRAVHRRDVVATSSDFEDNIVLRETPLLGDVVIKYRDVNNTEQTLDSSLYTVYLNDQSQVVVTYEDVSDLPAVYDRTDAVTFTYTIGLNALEIPAPYKTFVLLMVTKLYENPGDTALKYRSFAHSILFVYKNHS